MLNDVHRKAIGVPDVTQDLLQFAGFWCVRPDKVSAASAFSPTDKIGLPAISRG